MYGIHILVLISTAGLALYVLAKIVSGGSLATTSQGEPFWNSSVQLLTAIPLIAPFISIFLVFKIWRLYAQERFDTLLAWASFSLILIPILFAIFILQAFSIAMM